MANYTTSELRLVGTSAASDSLRAEIQFAARADAKVLVTGETGVGKDLIARLIHHSSRRRLAPMATINCAGMPETLLESELFGHVRGSFTDAHRDKPGIFESAANGTVFLDEVGEMSPRMQAVLLRFLETGELQRVGADRVHARVNVRVIAATNRDLMAEIKAGRFREDLFYRLNVLHIHVPPLRERREDIPALLDYYLDDYSRRHGSGPRAFASDVTARLCQHDWPGNIRQLKNVVERIVVKSSDETIEVHDLPRDVELPRPTVATDAVSAGVSDRSVVAQLMARLLEERESFWFVVHAPFMNRDLTRAHLTEVISRGLERTAGNYRSLVTLFNMPQSDYKRFLTFLSSHRCHVRFQAYRSVQPLRGPLPVARHSEPAAQVVGF
ncbi:MAG TPA: sigma-54 dependent transcriptional regulator [Vicinamibacterales bacterium]|jgi:transcriptional regulator with PAS, ATPase and Fis domain